MENQTIFEFTEHNQRIFEICSRYVKLTSDDWALDFGCGTGNLTALMADKFSANVIGLDLRKSAFYNPKHGFFSAKKCGNGSIIVGNCFDPALKQNYFSFLSCVEVLDHMDNYQLGISKISDLLVREGYVAIVVPNRRQIIEHHKGEITQLPLFGFYPEKIQNYLLNYGVSKGSWLYHLFSKKEIEQAASKEFEILFSSYLPYAFEHIKKKNKFMYRLIKGLYLPLFVCLPSIFGSTIIIIGKKV